MDEIVQQALKQRRLIDFYYHELHRVGEPHILGITNGITQILVYQIAGQSNSGKLPDWKRMDLNKISRLQILDKEFEGKRSFPSRRHSSWDSYLALIS